MTCVATMLTIVAFKSNKMQWLLVVAFFGIGCIVNGADDVGNTEIYRLRNNGIGFPKNDYNYRGYRRQGYRDEKYGTFYDEEEKTRLDNIFGYTGPSANDEPENLIRPCALNDWQCIRKYFAANSKCTPTYGPIPDPLKMDLMTFFFSAINVTFSVPNHEVRGMSSAKISEFYVNKRSGNLVLAIDVQNLNQTTPRGYFKFRRTAKESIVLADYTTINFQSVTLTAVIPKVPNLRLDLADIHADVGDGAPKFFIGPGAYNSTDPDVVTAYAELLALLPFVVREGFLFQSQLFTSIFIQRNICDFGLKLISV